MQAKKLALMALWIATAMILSYAESLIPPFTAIPGIKVGLANIAVVLALYTLGAKEAVGISLVRVLLMSLLFGHMVGFFFSLLGAACSLAVMLLVKRLGIFSAVGVSVMGGVAHNIGQILAAILVLGSAAVAYYLPVLLVSGVIAGVTVGIVSAFLANKLSALYNNSK